MAIERGTRLFRTLFISDVHLGARGCQADRLLDFLRYHDAETIYLVGDIVDGWQLRSGWYWPQPHNDVVQKLLRKARKGARLIYLTATPFQVVTRERIAFGRWPFPAPPDQRFPRFRSITPTLVLKGRSLLLGAVTNLSGALVIPAVPAFSEDP